MQLRSTVITAAVSAAAALAATGITYASAASAPAPQQAPAAAVPQQAPATAAPHGGSNGNNNSKGNEGNNNSKGNEGNDDDNDYNGHGGKDEGRIQINERSYSTRAGDCITVVSGLGAKSLNIRNDSRRTVEVFRGAVCDNGAPVATVGPHSSSDGVRPGCVEGIDIDKGVVASFRVIKRHHDED
ncbi:hypothetical protein AQJ66_36200 [Streptomyces bungoensis]|uniref:Uncharacterized protein n=1 Tax=Streptomyces bungoensis TaxID=285568 RepID=A0A101SJZ6_9ACTN|nr:hypothetical protein [Streptomyces bungoensis]KUN75306.1 hypothetical protein AQJ66_36200 [Streptomyces bungoensis]